MISTKAIFSSASFKCLKLNLSFKSYQNGFKTWSFHCFPIVPFKLTDIGEGIKEVTIKQWYVQPTQIVKQFDDLCEVESDKASVVLTSRYDGEIKSIYFEEGTVAPVGGVLLDIETEDNSKTANDIKIETTMKIEEKIKTTEILSKPTIETIITQKEPIIMKNLATPAVRRIAKEYNVDMNELKGSGRGGRVCKEDILNFINQPQTLTHISEKKEIISGYKKVMLKTMTESNKIPTLTLSDQIDVTELESIRQNIKRFLEEENIKITFLSFLVKAVSLSLQKYPILNSIVDKECNEIEYLNYHNLGIAIDTNRGLVVPNIKDVQRLNIKSVSKEIQRLQKAAIENTLKIHDLSNGTFTISNIGSIAGTVTKPLILPPQVAIVGVGRIQVLPRFDENDQIKKCSIINVSWAADHRIIDGGTIARFSNSVRTYLENPYLLMVES